jgi:hypothetical protein
MKLAQWICADRCITTLFESLSTNQGKPLTRSYFRFVIYLISIILFVLHSLTDTSYRHGPLNSGFLGTVSLQLPSDRVGRQIFRLKYTLHRLLNQSWFNLFPFNASIYNKYIFNTYLQGLPLKRNST